MRTNYIGERITMLRLAKGLSEYSLSKSIGKCESYINKVSSGHITPSLDMLITICEFFGLTLSEFFQEDAPPFSPTAAKITSLLPELSEEELKSLLVIVESMKNREKEEN
ncbi:MAG: helix-turn-helix transcriptional regulator [Lachnospiraceae bacterium]|nr:helix-turn-helix transcriptional regulator [Lachnospiraceae bacterium]